jgi:hypothetical protein
MPFRILCCGLFATGVLIANPVTVFDDFGPGNSFMPGPGIVVGCGAFCFGNAGDSLAWSFVPAVTTTLDEVDTVAFLGPTQQSTFLFTISADARGVPGATLESFGFALMSSTPEIFDTLSLAHPVLLAGQTYWFTASTMDLVNQAAAVGINSTGVVGPQGLRIGSGPWMPTTSSAYAVFRVTGDAASVPEPGSAVFIGAGLIALAVAFQGRK